MNELPTLSNILADLAERIRVVGHAAGIAEQSAAEKAIEVGHLLREAKQSCPHGQWLPFLDRAEMPEWKAQRYMKLAAAGIKPDTVSDLGGIGAALRWAAGLRLPDMGEALFVTLDDIPDDHQPFVMAWRDRDQGYRFCRFSRPPAEPWSFADTLTKPIIRPDMVLPAIYAALDYPFAEMSFQIGADEVPADLDGIAGVPMPAAVQS